MVQKWLAVLAVIAFFSLAVTGCTSALRQPVGGDLGDEVQWNDVGNEGKDALHGESADLTRSEENRLLTIIRNSSEFTAMRHQLLRPEPTSLIKLGEGLFGVIFDLKLDKEACSGSSEFLAYSYVIFIIDTAQKEVMEVVTSTPDPTTMEIELKFSREPWNNKRIRMKECII